MKATLASGGEHRDDMLVVIEDFDALPAEAQVLREIKHPHTCKDLDIREDCFLFSVYEFSKVRLPEDSVDPEDGFLLLHEMCCSAPIVDLPEGPILPEPKRTELEKLRVTAGFWLLEFSIRHDDGYTYETEPNWWAAHED